MEALSPDVVNGVIDVTLEMPTNVPSSVPSVLLSSAQVSGAQAVLDARYGPGRLGALADDAGSCGHLLIWRSLEDSLLQPSRRRECLPAPRG
jgi:hypothetical protein